MEWVPCKKQPGKLKVYWTSCLNCNEICYGHSNFFTNSFDEEKTELPKTNLGQRAKAFQKWSFDSKFRCPLTGKMCKAHTVYCPYTYVCEHCIREANVKILKIRRERMYLFETKTEKVFKKTIEEKPEGTIAATKFKFGLVVVEELVPESSTTPKHVEDWLEGETTGVSKNGVELNTRDWFKKATAGDILYIPDSKLVTRKILKKINKAGLEVPEESIIPKVSSRKKESKKK